MRVGRVAVLGAVVGWTAVAAVGAAAVGTAAPGAVAADPRVEADSCLVDVPEDAMCGWLRVPENRADPEAPEVAVAYVVVPARSPQPDAEPVVFMGGGPGSGTLQLAWTLAEGVDLSRHHDVVLLEQRGGARAEPSLHCPDASGALAEMFTRTDNLAAEAEPVAAAMRDCLADFVEDGGDPAAYTAGEAAADVRDLRVALGYDRWSLYGVSWSTQVMSEVARLDAGGVESVVLDSFLVPGADFAQGSYDGTRWALESLDERSGGAFGDSYTTLEQAAAALDERPEAITGHHPVTGETITYRLTGDDLMTLVHSALYDVELLPVLPYLLDRLAVGERGALHALVDVGVRELTSHTLGQYWVMQCQDEVPFRGQGGGHRELSIVPVAVDDVVCAELGLTPRPDAQLAVTHEQPTLVLAGASDPVTPARTAAAASTLADARFVEFAGVGHGVFLQSRCGRTMIAAWLDDRGADLDALCDPGEATYAVRTQEDLYPTSRIAQAAQAVSDGRWWSVLVPAVFAVVVLGWLVAGVVVTIARAVRRRPIRPGLSSLWTPLVGVVLLGGAGAALWSADAELPTQLLVGVPRVVPWLGLLLVVGAVTLALAWRASARRGRVWLALAAVVWVAFAAWFAWAVVIPS